MSTAEQIRQRLIPIPLDAGLVLNVRRPDVLSQIAANALPIEIYGPVIEQLAQVIQGKSALEDPNAAAALANFDEFINRWTCIAAVEPRVVLTEEEAIENPAVLSVHELEFDTKLTVFRMTARGLLTKGVRDAVVEFRRQQSEGPAA